MTISDLISELWELNCGVNLSSYPKGKVKIHATEMRSRMQILLFNEF